MDLDDRLRFSHLAETLVFRGSRLGDRLARNPMARTKRADVDGNAEESRWTYAWTPLGSPPNFFRNHGPFFWEDPFFGSKSTFGDFEFRRRLPPGHGRSRMASIVPWLISMSLIGAQTGPAPGPARISQELQAPLPPRISRIPSGTGYTSARCEHPSLDEAATKRFPGLLEDERLHRGLSSRPDVGFSEVFFDPPPASNLQRNLIHYPDVGTGNEVQEVTDAEPEVSPGRVHVPGHSYEPPDDRYPKDEYAGPAMDMVFSWTMVDFEYENSSARVAALAEGTYVPENVLPLGLDVWGERVFLTLPKWRDGVPATLATVPRISKTTSPKLRPYPSWEWHRSRTCEGLTSVFRIQVDECARLWVLDSGKVDVADSPFQACPPKILVFDLRTDRLLRKYPLTPDQIKQDSLYSNIAVDVRNGNCEGARAYLADVWRFGIVVYDFSADSSFRVQHRFFFPDPVASRYELHGLGFQWTDGIFGIALSPLDVHSDRTLFFHPMSSFREFAVSTSLLGDKESAEAHPDAFAPVGRPRAKDFGHSSGSAIARNGVMFFNMVTRDSVWCWDTRKEHDPRNLGVVGHSNVSLVFPNDIRVDHEDDQNVWLISNKLPMYLYGRLDLGEPAYRVFRANVRTAVRNTVCDPDYVVSDSDSGYDETC